MLLKHLLNISLLRAFSVLQFGDEIQCTEPVYISSDFIYARCTDNGQDVYSGLQYGIDYRSKFLKRELNNESDINLSVYLYGYDALSNLIVRGQVDIHILVTYILLIT
jgi:hypothetical protein